MSTRVVVIGDALIDELRDENGVREFVGGAGLNVAVGLTRLGLSATLIAMVGDDVPGDHIRSYLDDYGVDLLASPAPNGSSRAVSIRNGSGEPQYEFNTAAKNRRVHIGDAERAAIEAADMVVISCVPFDDAAQAQELAAALDGAAVAIDPNPRAGMLSDRAEFVRGFEALAATATLVKVGDDDAALLYGQPLEVLRERLIDLGAGAVVATAGAAGATVQTPTALVSRPISNVPGRIVDTMGGGDAVLATTVALLIEHRAAGEGDTWGDTEWAAVLERAMDVAAATCRHEGALLRLEAPPAGSELDRIGT